MAKKKSTSAKKKTRTKKKQTSRSPNKIILVALLLVIVGSLVFYGLYKTNQFVEKSISTNKDTSTKSTKKNNSTNNLSNNFAKSQNKKTKKQSKFDPNDINAKDKLEESNTINENIPKYSNSDAYYYTSNFDFGWPAYDKSDAIVEHQYYTFSYNEKTEQPNWVAYLLTKKNLDNAQFKRKNDFRIDPSVNTQSAALSDYKKSGYDRGHLAPAADFSWNKEALSQTFYMSNMSPQQPGFNRGIWKRLEEKIRSWAKSNQKIYVVTGPIIKGISKKIGTNKVSVPSHYYKAILDIQEPGIKAIGFVIKHKKSDNNIMNFAISIDDLEKQTGLDFFPNIPDELEKKIESNLDKNLWK